MTATFVLFFIHLFVSSQIDKDETTKQSKQPLDEDDGDGD